MGICRYGFFKEVDFLVVFMGAGIESLGLGLELGLGSRLGYQGMIIC